jgi:hypothetical protein
MPTKKTSSKKKVVSSKKAPAKKSSVNKPTVKKPVVKKKLVAKKKVATKKKTAVKVAHGSRTVTHHRVVLYEKCKNCDHIPDRAGTLLGALSLIAILLSGMVLSLAEVPANWIELIS